MVIDSSAIIAILFAEPEARVFLSEIAAARICRLSAANFVEVGIVYYSRSKIRKIGRG
jgi:ribonuclease VapC